jgi:hypothetical protein
MGASRLLRAWTLGPVLGAFAASACVTVRATSPPPPPPRQVTAITFYDSLAPHGEWIFISGFGRVWRPWRHVVGVGFIPYSTGGHWEYTPYGWVFVSDWEWGRTVYHYGRWFLVPGEGWLWMPDTVWGPAWVEWRYGGGYVCWAPLPPPRVTVIVATYRPVWHVVPTPYFPHGRHVRHLLPEHEATPVLMRAPRVPPRGQTTGERWHIGPPAYAVGAEAKEQVRVRNIQRPEPLPSTVLEVPKAARVRQLPSPGQRAGPQDERETARGRVEPQPGPPPGRAREPARVEPEHRPPPPVQVEPERRPTPPLRVQPEPRPTPPARVAPAGERRRTEPATPPPPSGDPRNRPVQGAEPRPLPRAPSGEERPAPRVRPAPVTKPEERSTPRPTKRPNEAEPRRRP